MPVLGLIPIRIMLRLLFFSPDFGHKMVYPLIALFLGTGNQTAHVPSAIVERLFNDPNMRLWNYDPDTLLPNLPTMVTFDNLHEFYDAWRRDLESKGVNIRLNTAVTHVLTRTTTSDRGGVLLRIAPVDGDEDDSSGARNEIFDDMVMCVLADDALRLLGKTATLRERFILGGARFYDDVTVTHWDNAYFNRQYETQFDARLCAEPKTQAQREQVNFATKGEGGDNPERPGGGFRPMYYTKTYLQDPKKIEMSFDCTNYQHQLLKANNVSGSGSGNGDGDGDDSSGYPHVYQSIFLDKRDRNIWTWPEIDKDKIIAENWWHQLGHRWTHYLRVVPLMMFINGRNHTWFAGSWTLVVSSFLSATSNRYEKLRFFFFAFLPSLLMELI